MELKDCEFYTEENNQIRCNLCPHYCLIENNKTGLCGVRINIAGKLKCLNYSKLTAIDSDIIEKNQIYHYLPGHTTLKIGSFGCNMKCKFCNNFEISNIMIGKYHEMDISPDMILELTKVKDTQSITYSFNEPFSFYEFLTDTTTLAKRNNIRNIVITNGLINSEPLLKILPNIDAIRIDIKSFNEKFYLNNGGILSQILKNIKTIFEKKIHLELSYLVIESETKEEDFKKFLNWIINNLSKEIPIHISKFIPAHLMKDQKETSNETLNKFKKIAKEKNFKYVYLSNYVLENSICNNCNSIVINREIKNNKINVKVEKNLIDNSSCDCGEKIYGYFKK